MKKIFVIFALVSITIISNSQQYQPNWQSLGQYSCPDWYRDAKFGIFLHWGPQTVPEHQNAWYARQLYMEKKADWGGHGPYDYHVKNYGHPSEFGFKDIIPLWKAERWNPDSLVLIFKNAGAKYIVPVACHHDNFDNFASTYQPWNSVNMGPKKDIVGGWEKACRKYGLRFGVSTHMDRTWDWFSPAFGSDKKGSKKRIPYDGNMTKEDGKGKWWEGYDPKDLYTRPHKKSELPDKEYCDNWFNRNKELVDKYKPDLMYFDGPIPIVVSSPVCRMPEARKELAEYGLKLVSYYYNQNQQWHSGKMEAVINVKDWKKGEVEDRSAVVFDVEKGSIENIVPDPWQTCTSICGGWFYSEYSKDAKPELNDTVIIHNMADIVSKNGNMLLNIGLKPDGTIPDVEYKILMNIGNWMNVNGEAIFGSRPWRIYGEGPLTKMKTGDFNQNNKPMSGNEVRYTTKDGFVYAIVMAKNSDGKVILKSLNSAEPGASKITGVSLLGNNQKIDWKQDENGLNIQFPNDTEKQIAFVFKIAL